MADAMTLAKAPTETISAYNKRLREACGTQPVTEVSISVVDGQPFVTLFCEMVEADEEDVAEALALGETIALKEMIPEEDPLIAQVSRVDCTSDESARKTQAHTERLFERADGGVVKLLNATGPIYGWLESPDKKQHYCQQSVNYVLVAYLADSDGENDGEEDAKMERDLQKKAS